MTTQCMKDSVAGDKWIYDSCNANPLQHFGEGAFRSLARLSYVQLDAPKHQKNQKGELQYNEDGTPRLIYGVSLLFPPFVNVQPIEDEVTRIIRERWPKSYQGGQTFGIKRPIRDQGERANKEGYTPGCKFINLTTDKKPMLYGRPPEAPLIETPGQFYSGMWAIVSFNVYASKSAPTVGAGLNWVMAYGDDKRLDGGGGAMSEAQARQQMQGIRAATPVQVPGHLQHPQDTQHNGHDAQAELRALGLI